MTARRWLPWVVVGWLALGVCEWTLAGLLEGDALAAAMTAPRPSPAVLGGLAVVLSRVVRLVFGPSAVFFLVAREILAGRPATPTSARPRGDLPSSRLPGPAHSTGQGP